MRPRSLLALALALACGAAGGVAGGIAYSKANVQPAPAPVVAVTSVVSEAPPPVAFTPVAYQVPSLVGEPVAPPTISPQMLPAAGLPVEPMPRPVPSPSSTKPAEEPIEQGIARLKAIQAQKAELTKAEQEVIKALRQKSDKLIAELQKLGVTEAPQGSSPPAPSLPATPKAADATPPRVPSPSLPKPTSGSN